MIRQSFRPLSKTKKKQKNPLPFYIVVLSINFLVVPQDPNGIPVRRWQGLQTNAGGIVSESFQLSDQPTYGTWNIRVDAFVSMSASLFISLPVYCFFLNILPYSFFVYLFLSLPPLLHLSATLPRALSVTLFSNSHTPNLSLSISPTVLTCFFIIYTYINLFCLSICLQICFIIS